MSIRVQKISKAYQAGGALVVKEIDLEVRAGELFVLLGASGSGKSTLLRLIAGLMQPDSGQIWLHGREVTNLPPQKRNTGFVFQNYSLFRHMTIAQNIAFGLSVRKASAQQQAERVASLLDLIQLPGYGGRYPAQLSGGQQQRVALARALAANPDVLLLDEPFGALDSQIRGQLRQNLRAIQKRLGVTTILVTHDQEEAFELADRIGIVHEGNLISIGTPEMLYRRPSNKFTATFLGAANLFPAQRDAHQLYFQNVILAAPPDTDHLANRSVDILARPEEIELAPTSGTTKGQVLGWGAVQDVVFAGAMQRVSVNLMNAELPTIQALLSTSETEHLRLEPGQEVIVALRHFHLLPADHTAPVWNPAMLDAYC
jgi:sulfate/thiosulfate transport system ATP-binding protein